MIELELVLAEWRPIAAASMHACYAWQVTATDDGQLAEPFSDADSVLAVGVGEGGMSCMVPGLRFP
jgi:hypothetical protein